jgi:hypothetical protein
MSRGIKYTLLVAVGAAALAACGVVVYNFAANGWRLGRHSFDVDFFTDDRQSDLRDTVAARSFDFDSGSFDRIVVDSGAVDLHVVQSTTTRTIVAMLLAGDTADSTQFRASAALEPPRTLRIVAHPDSGWKNSSRGKAEATITLPRIDGIEVHLTDGSIVVEGVEGKLDVSTRHGDIRLASTRGGISLASASGDVSLEGCRANGTIDAAGGRVILNLCDGELNVAASDGIAATNHSGALTASTRAGGIAVQLITPTSRATLDAAEGNISLQVPLGSELTFTVQAPPSHVATTLPLDSLDDSKVSGGRFTATLNGGGLPVIIHAQKGNVLLSAFGTEPVIRPSSFSTVAIPMYEPVRSRRD